MARKSTAANKGSKPGRLRIVAGKWRSRLLPVADVDGLRPTSLRIRETLFNWLGPEVRASHCLDLFAGSGALAFEALSRGAASATMLEKSSVVAEALRSSAKLLEAADIRIECTDTMAWLKRGGCHQRGGCHKYDIVFIDPPFAQDWVEECCRLLHSNGWLKDHAAIYIEQDKRRPLPTLPRGWQIVRDGKAGNVRYMLARMSEGESGDSIRNVSGDI